MKTSKLGVLFTNFAESSTVAGSQEVKSIPSNIFEYNKLYIFIYLFEHIFVCLCISHGNA